MPLSNRARTVETTPSLSWTRGLPTNSPLGPRGTEAQRKPYTISVPSPSASRGPLGRGLEDVSHLFLSHKTGAEALGDRAAVRVLESSSPPSGSREGITLLRPASVTRDHLAIILMEFDGALEEGLRAIDANIPCHPCGEIDLLAVDRANQLTIIDFD